MNRTLDDSVEAIQVKKQVPLRQHINTSTRLSALFGYAKQSELGDNVSADVLLTECEPSSTGLAHCFAY